MSDKQNESTTIYHATGTLKPYKKKRLFYSPHFRTLYFQIDPAVTLYQREMQLCTHMFLQRLTRDEILIVMASWYKRHKITRPNWWRLRHFVLPKSQEFAQPLLKEQKQQEYLRRKERQQQKKLELERQQLQLEQEGEEINRRSA